jgi:ribonuclease P protein component
VDTIKSSREIERMFGEGKRASTPLLVGISIDNDERRGQQGRVAFIAGKKLGGAVVRNRAKRVLRESVRRVGGPWEGHDVALIARAGVPSAPPEALDQAVRNVVRRLGVAG